MIKISLLLAASLLLAYHSQQRSEELSKHGVRYRCRLDPAFVGLVLLLSLASGLRVHYNDTSNYIAGYARIPELGEFLSDPQNLHLLKNPLFNLFQSLLRTLRLPAQMLIFISGVFTQVCFLSFFKRYCRHFTASIFIFFTLGTFCVTISAIKQVLAMSVMTLAFPYLEKRRWGRFYLYVFIAMLLHTYALAYAVLPLFIQRPWKLFTYLFAFFVMVIMLNFEEAIAGFLDQAGEAGKEIAEYEVFDNNSVNLLRLGVYAVTPLISLLFRRWIFHDSSEADHILAHMSIISFAFMVLGTNSGANMFGRMGNYFELGTIIMLPEMLERTFNKRSYRFISRVAIVCFLGFFVYANGIHGRFDSEFHMVDIIGLLLK